MLNARSRDPDCNVPGLTQDVSGDLVARIVERLPIGIAIRCRGDADWLYRNAAAFDRESDLGLDGDSSQSNRSFDDEIVSFTIDGSTYEVVTSVDTTRHYRIQEELTTDQ